MVRPPRKLVSWENETNGPRAMGARQLSLPGPPVRTAGPEALASAPPCVALESPSPTAQGGGGDQSERWPTERNSLQTAKVLKTALPKMKQ